MKKVYFPYYISRFILSIGFALVVFGASWGAVLFAVILFAGFLFYLHGGWFRIDLANPLFPLRRDWHAREIQRKALIAGVFAGLVISFGSVLATQAVDAYTGVFNSLGIIAALLAYFVTQFVLYLRA